MDRYKSIVEKETSLWGNAIDLTNEFLVHAMHYLNYPTVNDFPEWYAGAQLHADYHIAEEANELIVAVQIPGAVKKSLTARIDGHILRISGEKKFIRQGKEESIKFKKALILPYTFEEGITATATYEDGILKLKIPHKATVQVNIKVE